ncbi:MCE family protein [Nonomuraea sp. NN258]|uniref:MCE family protein n=1 Tax=Nonomuraea antri TaxID=2730852 RepID=UPI001569A5EB|nr:MCE family protein [Nonomuraea antri]NRQ39300.1 MCE family protein [Nonomuraea antri]
MSAVRAAAATAAATVVLSVAVAGCGISGIRDVPLPGGAELGERPYTVTAEFASVLDLVPQAAVRVNDVAVGRVTEITLPKDGWTAQVTMLVNGDVKLPADAEAWLEQTSLLGEKYVQLAAPEGRSAGGTLGDGARIPLRRTNRNTEVEELFGALSMLLNGGGLAHIRTITRELDKALGGNEAEIRALLKRLNELTSNLETHKKDITDALDGLDRLSSTLASRKKEIGTVLEDLTPGLKVLEEQRGSLVTMLGRLEELSRVAVDTVERSKADMVADLRALEPTLRKLSDAGRDLPRALEVSLTFPFSDEVMNVVKGDYLNAYLSMAAAPDVLPIIPPIAIKADPSDEWPELPFDMVEQQPRKAGASPSPSKSKTPTPTPSPSKSRTPTPEATEESPTPSPEPPESPEPSPSPVPTPVISPSAETTGQEG